MSENEINLPAQAWGESYPLNKNISLEKTDDDMYYDLEYPDDGCFEKNQITDDDDMSRCEQIAKKGEYYINIE